MGSRHAYDEENSLGVLGDAAAGGKLGTAGALDDINKVFPFSGWRESWLWRW